MQKKWTQVYFLIIAGYLILTILYGYLGYFVEKDSLIRGTDSFFYYIYLRSLFFDGDLNFVNELMRFYGEDSHRIVFTSVGVPENIFSIGPAILWTPFFLVAHLATLLSISLGGNLQPDGFSFYYQAGIYIGNSLYGLLGIFAIAGILKIYLRPFPTLMACLGIMFASPLTYYLWPFTVLSHNVSLASTALFLYFWLTRGIKPITAVMAGLMFLSRWQNALFILPLVIFSTNHIIALIKRDSGEWKQWVRSHFLFLVVFFAVMSPQMAAWRYIFGSWVLVPQGSGFIDVPNAQFLSTLFSFHHGLFSWHPLLMIGLVGIILFFKKNRLLSFSFLTVFVLQWTLNAAVDDWWAGWSFGNRRFISLLPIFALGFGFVIEKFGDILKGVSVVVLLFLGVWNQLFVYQYQHGIIPRGKALTFREMFIDKFHLSRTIEADKAVVKALYFLDRKDYKTFGKYSKRAYKIDRFYRNVFSIHGLSCILLGNSMEGAKVFREWHEIEPREILAQWGLAEFLVKNVKYGEANKLFLRADFDEKEATIFQAIREKLKNKSKTLIDNSFYELFNKRFEERND